MLIARPHLPMLTALLLAAMTAGAAAQDAAPPPAEKAPAPDAARTLGLGLANLTGPWPGRFSLFSDYWMPNLAVAVWGPPTLFGTAADAGRPAVARLRSFGLGWRFDEKLDADGKKQLVFAPLYRDWDDLSGWEKLGLALQYAGAAAAIGHFVGKAF